MSQVCEECKNTCSNRCVCTCHDRTISQVYFGYLVGQVREVLEASIIDERQLRALKGIMDDRLYEWWKNSITPEGDRVIDAGNPREARKIEN